MCLFIPRSCASRACTLRVQLGIVVFHLVKANSTMQRASDRDAPLQFDNQEEISNTPISAKSSQEAPIFMESGASPSLGRDPDDHGHLQRPPPFAGSSLPNRDAMRLEMGGSMKKTGVADGQPPPNTAETANGQISPFSNIAT